MFAWPKEERRKTSSQRRSASGKPRPHVRVQIEKIIMNIGSQGPHAGCLRTARGGVGNYRQEEYNTSFM